ncbi:MAG: AEC family transporter [bacterium]|nr:AEC family transporter [bacterium]
MQAALHFLATLFEVVLPVYATVGTGYLAQRRLKIEARSLAQLSYNILMPAFVFEHLHRLKVPWQEANAAIWMILSVHLLVVLAAVWIGWALKLSRAGKAALVMVVVYGNIANLGIPMIQFQYGAVGLPSGLIYMLAISFLAIFVCIAAAEWATTGALQVALLRAITTPPILAMFPALLVNSLDFVLPLFLSRTIGLMAAAAIPVMLLGLGVQLAGVRQLRWDRRIGWAAGLKLVLAPALVGLLAPWFGVEGIWRSTAILQAGTPAAVTTAIVAIKYQVEPDLVTLTVLSTTLLGLLSLSYILSIA